MSNSTSLSDFIIEKKLGKGSFGYVYLVRRKIDNKIYALKQVFFENLSKRDQENSLNEVRILASINHPNVIGYKEAFWEDNKNCLNIVMEYADDGDLETKIKKIKKEKGIFTESLIWSYSIQMIEGLKALHNKKIMHRDLKSANIFLIKDKHQCKIGDMNVSKIIKDKVLLTQTGTPFYASPEVWNDDPYSYKSDLWSIGIIIYEMCALNVPFYGKNLDELYKNVCSGKIERISQIYSEDLWKMILMLLQVDVKKRCDCKEFLDSELIMKKIIEMKENYSECTDIEKNKNSIEGTLLRTIKFKEYKDIKAKLPMNKNYTTEKKENNNIITNNNINNIYYINYTPDYNKYFPSKFITNNFFMDDNNVIVHTDINVKKSFNLKKNAIFNLIKSNNCNINNSNTKSNKSNNYFNKIKNENEKLSKKRPASSTRLISKNNNIKKNIFNLQKNNKNNQSKEVKLYKKNNNLLNCNNNQKKYTSNYKKVSQNKKHLIKNNSTTNNLFRHNKNNINNLNMNNSKNNINNKAMVRNYSGAGIFSIRPLSASPNKRNNPKLNPNNYDSNKNNNKSKYFPKNTLKEKYDNLLMSKSKSNNKSRIKENINNSNSSSYIYNIYKNNSYNRPMTSAGNDKNNIRKINVKAYNNKLFKKEVNFFDNKYKQDNTEPELFMMINPIKIREERKFLHSKNNVNITFNESNNCFKNNINFNKRKNNSKYNYFELFNNTNSSKNAGSKRKEPVRVLKIFK